MKNFVFDLYGTLADIRTDETSARFRKKTDALMLRKFGIAHFCKQLQAVAPYSSAEDDEQLATTLRQTSREPSV